MTEPVLRQGRIDEFKPASNNVNLHTERGLYELEKSMQEDGFVAALTVAADGEALDGTARLEKSAEVFPEEVLVLEHDGTKPVVLVRTDIPNAHTEQAKRISVRANRVAQIDLNWNLEELIDTAKEVNLGKLWTKDEWDHLVSPVLQPPEPEIENIEYVEEENGIVCPNCGHRITRTRSD